MLATSVLLGEQLGCVSLCRQISEAYQFNKQRKPCWWPLGHFSTSSQLQQKKQVVRPAAADPQQPEYNALRNCVISSFVQIKLNIRSVCEYKSRPSCSSSSRTNFKYVFHGKLFSSEVKAS
ncbi:hypothetical protein T11_12836 [Trichinella zimbabwensis]|uniref:Uncharacterized protein n=1 Tax=Trichinella zimbabwensis TaxID=268475 RepID=A0A0V1HYZ7_9BILA|nr:hypothetical protein T11_12836 [Trichinella zimbabwensis]